MLEQKLGGFDLAGGPESLAELQPERADVWCALSDSYLQKPDCADDLLRVTDPILESQGPMDRGTLRPAATIGSGKANPFGRQNVRVSPSIHRAAPDA